ncbi:MAG: hypothetical protein ACON4U_11480 [Myxococcota bacterium]
MIFNLSFIHGLSMGQIAMAQEALTLNIVSNPSWSHEQYESFIIELKRHDINAQWVPDPTSHDALSESSFWLFHGLAGPYHGLNTPPNTCGLILLGVPTQVPVTSLLPNIPIPSPGTKAGRWFEQWRQSEHTQLPLTKIPTLVLSSSKDYLAPPEYAYKGLPFIDFVRFSPINSLPEPTHLEFVDNPMTVRLISRWIKDHPC